MASKVSLKTNDAMKNQGTVENINFKNTLQNDDVFTKSELISLSQITGLSCRKGLEKVVVSGGQIVNVVSDSYGHLPNQRFFPEVEIKLINAGMEYVTRSINRDSRSFAVDYILADDNWVVRVKNGKDQVRPMLRFVNSYDGSCPTAGHLGFFREVCSNGLHVAQSRIGFKVKHRGNVIEIVIPEIGELVEKFMDNEFYSLHKKFEVLAEKPIPNLNDFVKVTAEHFKLFQFECSEKNPNPSLNARTVINAINRESNLLESSPNFWHGYNAFNSILHGKLKKSFESQKTLDEKIFEYLLEV